MREPLVVGVAQPLTAALDVVANAAAHAAAVRAAGARVVVFPELSLTGYELDAPVIAAADARLAPIAAACEATGSIALVGAPVAAPRGDGSGRRSIGMLAIDGSGARIVYRKMWLGVAEREALDPGDAPAVLEVDGWRLGLAICRDTGIPAHAAATAALGMDAYVAGVLEDEVDAGVPEARARRVAADHGVWVAIASFAGSAGGGYERAAGRSGIWDPDGVTVSRAGPGTGSFARAALR